MKNVACQAGRNPGVRVYTPRRSTLLGGETGARAGTSGVSDAQA